MATKQRDKIMALLSESVEPMVAGEISTRLDLHVTTARFHLAKLIEDGRVETTTVPTPGVGRPRVGYQVVRRPPTDALLGHLLGQLGSTQATREHAGAEAGRLWAEEHAHPVSAADLPDPVTVASDILGTLGFQVSNIMSAFGSHELRLCSCPLQDIARTHPEVARGVARGVIEQALAASSPALSSQYAVTVAPDPAGGDCEIVLRLAPLRRTATHTESPLR
ncbi:ArsR family transcriptional regulator [Gordonia metallireducens]|uniref:ArsR family transcriptional regulator n=1 Tax=Gordonia metallireducens TaxID=2897779 RepID=UPI001E5537C3|nr:ArsR family transcriptional regulator [Gordonia metallireducens]